MLVGQPSCTEKSSTIQVILQNLKIGQTAISKHEKGAECHFRQTMSHKDQKNTFKDQNSVLIQYIP